MEVKRGMLVACKGRDNSLSNARAHRFTFNSNNCRPVIALARQAVGPTYLHVFTSGTAS